MKTFLFHDFNNQGVHGGENVMKRAKKECILSQGLKKIGRRTSSNSSRKFFGKGGAKKTKKK